MSSGSSGKGSGEGEEEGEGEDDPSSYIPPMLPLFEEEEVEESGNDGDPKSNTITTTTTTTHEHHIDHTTRDDAAKETLSPEKRDPSREQALQKFREQWKEELHTRSAKQSAESAVTLGTTPLSSNSKTSSLRSSRGTSPSPIPKLASTHGIQPEIFDKARYLFMQGIDQEERGMMLEAVRSYNRAIHLVPEIEALLFNVSRTKKTTTTTTNSRTSGNVSGHESPCNTEFTRDSDNLMTTLTSRLYSGSDLAMCTQERQSTAVDAGTQRHMSDLPLEVLMTILKWVVSPDLDLRSLEMFSAVCAGFYVMARDPELWNLACIRTWGARCVVGHGGAVHATDEEDTEESFLNWRQMYIERAHVWHSGVYIAKTTYVRHGETSFQDQFYRPWHMVVYYRYLRFFSDGTVLMLTTPDAPEMVLPHIRFENSRYQGLMKGKFHYLSQDTLAARVVWPKRNWSENSSIYPYAYRSKKYQAPYEHLEHTFCLEMKIETVRRRPHARLSWLSYHSIGRQRNGIETKTEFDLNEQSFPPYNFSRVISYTATTSAPLL